jgi:hypothetical protein
MAELTSFNGAQRMRHPLPALPCPLAAQRRDLAVLGGVRQAKMRLLRGLQHSVIPSDKKAASDARLECRIGKCGHWVPESSLTGGVARVRWGAGTASALLWHATVSLDEAATRSTECRRRLTIYPVGLSDAPLFPEVTESSRGEK